MSFNKNSGYIGQSRSVRSKEAIDNYEMPISQLNQDIIKKFIEDFPEYYELRNEPLAKWKSIASMVGRSSWHHTGKYYSKTNHFDIEEIAFRMMQDPIECETYYQEDRLRENNAKKLKKESDLKYGHLIYEVWEQKLARSVYKGQATTAGIIDKDWLYDLNAKRHLITGNKVVKVSRYNTFREFSEKHPAFQNKVKEFEDIKKSRLK